MSRRNKDFDLQEWFSAAFRGLAVCVCGLLVYQFQQLNATMAELTTVTRSLELRIKTIEADTEAKRAQYERLLVDVPDIKVDLAQMKERISIIADFITKMTQPQRRP